MVKRTAAITLTKMKTYAEIFVVRQILSDASLAVAFATNPYVTATKTASTVPMKPRLFVNK